MADICRIKNKSGTTYDFLTGVLKIQEWDIAEAEDGNILETMTLVGKGTNDQIKDAVNSIEEFINQVVQYWQRTTYNECVWWEVSADSETAKRALIMHMQIYSAPEGAFTPILGKGGAYYILEILHGAWEHTASSNTSKATGVSCLGGGVTLSAIKGSLPGRIYKTELTAGASQTDAIAKVWCGIKPNIYGVSSFVPVWELEKGTAVVDTTACEQSGASPGAGANNAMCCDFATTETMAKRVQIRTLDIIGDTNYEHFVGEYVLLGRIKMPDAYSEFMVQARVGYFAMDDANYAYTTLPFKIEGRASGTGWHMINFGVIRMPPFPYKGAMDVFYWTRDFSVQIYAERLAYVTQGRLWLDCLVLVPYEHFYYFEGSNIVYTTVSTKTQVYVNEDAARHIIHIDEYGNPSRVLMPAVIKDWVYPIEGGKLFLVGERATGVQNIDDELSVQLYYYPRARVHFED